MIINSIHIQNFCCFAEDTFHFHPDFTLIVGNNATGKSSLLNALAVSIGSWLIEIPGQKHRAIYSSEVRRINHYEGELLLSDPTGEETFIAAEGVIANKEIKWNRPRTSAGTTTTKDAKEIRSIAKAIVQDVTDQKQPVLPVIAYYGTGRLWGAQRVGDKQKDSVETLGKVSRYYGYKNSLNPSSNAKLLNTWLKKMARIEYEESVKLETLQAVWNALEKVFPDCTKAYWSSKEDEMVFEFNNNNRLPFSLLSDGQRNSVALIADIVMRCSQLNPALKGDASKQTPGVVIIDEIDLHLHPKWQRTIVSDLKGIFPKIQFIATSHSPFIIQSLKAASVISLDPKSEAFDVDREMSIEEIADSLMMVDDVERSASFRKMVDTAKKYYALLDSGEDPKEPESMLLKDQLDQLILPYRDDAAFVAFLEMKREAAGLGEMS